MIGKMGAAVRNGLLGIGVALASAGAALAQGTVGVPHPGQMNLSEPATPVMERLVALHTGLLWIITVITLFVLALMVYVMVKFRASANPVPSQTTHHTLLEVAWTVLPIFILIGIAIPSFRLLYFMDRTFEAGMTVKVVAHQWYWTYEYQDLKTAKNEVVSFDSYMLKKDDWAKLPDADKRTRPWLLAVDNELVVPVDTNVRVLVASTDVMHSWAVPAFGVKQDAIIGRTNETWFKATKEGVFYGQCSQICGKDHAYMPIAVRVVSKAEFEKWSAARKTAGFAAPAPAIEIAAVAPR